MYRGLVARKAAKRFSLLLLEEEEDYVADWVATCRWPANVSGCWSGSAPVEGRVRVCTRSLFFEPDDIKLPIVRLPLASTQSLQAGGGPGPATFSLTCTSVTKMKANMEEVPYVFEKGKTSVWVFSLMYAPLQALLPTAQQLLAANKLPKPQRTAALEAFVRVHEDACVFDTSRLADFSERILLDLPAIQLTPLVRERGHLVVTNTRLYFQPLHNVSGDNPVRSHPLTCVAAIARRRNSLRPLGLEVFFVRPSDTRTASSGSVSAASGGVGSTSSPAPQGPAAYAYGSSSSRAGSGGVAGSSLEDLEMMGGGQVWDGPSAFFAFRSEAEREAVAAQLARCPCLGAAIPHAPLPASAQGPGSGRSASQMVHVHSSLLEAQGGWLLRVTAAWQAARISNFDYLMYLNLAAGRSFNDLAQWPVFPWVVRNWVGQALDLNDPSHFRDLTKPVGALNPARLREFRKRYEEMPHDSFEEGAIPPFLYGTHYSTPGYVMYWLLRAAPAHMLRLQNGRFDAPDRLFHGMQESWESVNNSSTDVKELIPEFYLPGGTWLVNAHRLPLGVRQNGQPVTDVELPPWAHDPEHFLAMHRAALEAPPVSRSLHHWIDLVFGHKQRGAAAEAADNLFYHLTYEGAVDVSKVTDPIELKALETQINEFGQTPRQLFMSPHPARAVIPPAPDPTTVFKHLAVSASSGPQPGPTASTASTTPATTTTGSGISGTESGHRALALALISALSQAAAFDSPEPVPLALTPSPSLESAARTAPARSQGDTAVTAAQQLANTGVACTADSRGAQQPSHAKDSTRSTPSGPDQAAAEGGDGAAAGTGGAAADSWAGSMAGSMVNAAGGVLAGLLKLGRYKQPAAAGVPASKSDNTLATTGGDLAGAPGGNSSTAAVGLQRPGSNNAGSTSSQAPSSQHSGAGLPSASPTSTAATAAAVGRTASDAAAAGPRTSSTDSLVFVGGGPQSPQRLKHSPFVPPPGSSTAAAAGPLSGAGSRANDIQGPEGTTAAAAAAAGGEQGLQGHTSRRMSSAGQQAEGGQQGHSTAITVPMQAPGSTSIPTTSTAITHDLLLEQLSDLTTILGPEASCLLSPIHTPHGQADSAQQAASPHTLLAAHSSATAAASSVGSAGRAGQASPIQSSTPPLAAAKARCWVPSEWSEGLPDRLHACGTGGSRQGGAVGVTGSRSVILPVARDSISGVATWRPPGGSGIYVYCTTAGGLLRVLQLSAEPSGTSSGTHLSHTVFRSQQFDGDLLCLAPLHGASHLTPSSSPGHTSSHPLLLAGSHNQRVYVYSVQQGQLLGSFQAHEDAVCALAVPMNAPTCNTTGSLLHGHSCWDWAQPPSRFFTASWDCTIKSWALGSGRAPWSIPPTSPAAQPEMSWDLGEGVWALAAGHQDGSSSQLVVGGTEEGHLVACDVRASRPLWRVSVSQDYVGGLALTPCGRYVTAGTADGALTLLDVRHLGAQLAVTHTSSPVRCCVCDSRLVLAGTEGGCVAMWDVGLMSAAYTRHAGATPPGPDGQYRAWKPAAMDATSALQSGSVSGSRGGSGGVCGVEDASLAPISAIAVTANPKPHADEVGVAVDLVVGREDGSVLLAVCN